MFRKLLLSVVAVLFMAGTAFGQSGTLKGTVTDAKTGEPLIGVNVYIPDLQKGSPTDQDGQFTIENVDYGTYTVRASFVGYSTSKKEVDISQGTVNFDISLTPSSQQLEGVVVSALGVKSEKKSLGYSVQKVSGDELTQAKTSNFVNSMKGKIAGANITSSNAMGGSSRIVLRGASSLTGNNQPLFVVDGIPLDNSNFTSQAQATGSAGYDYGNAISSIDPNNIQSVSVLKGVSATALYGSRGANGVVQITTKNGSKSDGFGVSIKSSVEFDQVYGLPDYQNKYGGGANAPFSTNGKGQQVVDFATDESWGPRLDGRMVRQWYSYDDVNGKKGQETPWVAHPDNVKDFFNTGTTFNNNVTISKGSEDYSYNLSLSRADHNDVFPNGSSKQSQVGFSGQAGLTSKLHASLSANYIYTDFTGRPGTGYGGVNVFQQFNQFGQRQQDLGDGSYASSYLREDGTQRGWNWKGEAGAKSGTINFSNNPYWVRNKNYEADDKQRLYGKAALTYDINDWLNLKGNVRTDFYTDRRGTRFAVGSQEQSQFTEANREVQETNARATLNFDRSLSQSLSLNGLVGTNVRFSNYSRNVNGTQGGLSVPGVYTVENSKSRPSVDDYYQSKRVNSFFAKAKLGYNEMLYLELNGRNDRSSSLPEDNNSYFYYGATGTFIFTDLSTFQDNDVLTFGKVYASYSKVGNGTDPYRLSTTYPIGSPFGSKPTVSVSNTLNNSELKPEKSYAWEIGTNLEFFQSRAKLQVSYYNRRTEDQILPVDVSKSSGYSQQIINAGELTNKGLEAEISLTPIQSNNGFRWDISANWAKNVSSVEKLARGLNNYTLGRAPFGVSVNARVGGGYGTLVGSDFKYKNGKKVVKPDGTYKAADGQKVLGNYQPDWTGGLSTSIYYKGFSASAAIDGQKGGDIYSISNSFGNYAGIFANSARGNVREAGLIADGVQADGSKNTVRADPEAFFKGLFGIKGSHVYDASYIKLRQVRIAYDLPVATLENTPLKGVTVAVSGQNLATLFKNTPNIDPSTALSSGNVQGIESGQIPPTRSYSFTVQLDL